MSYRGSRACRSRLWCLPRATIPRCERCHEAWCANKFSQFSSRAGKISRHLRKLHGLPHAGQLLWQAGHDQIPGWIDVGFAIPGLGIFVGPNLTPDKQTGLGNWTADQIVTALTTGKTPEGRILAPIMPWHAYANLTKSDALAIAAYLKSLPPVSHQVGGPYGPNQTPAESVMVVVPPAVYSGLPKPGGSAPPASPTTAPASTPPGK